MVLTQKEIETVIGLIMSIIEQEHETDALLDDEELEEWDAIIEKLERG